MLENWEGLYSCFFPRARLREGILASKNRSSLCSAYLKSRAGSPSMKLTGFLHPELLYILIRKSIVTISAPSAPSTSASTPHCTVHNEKAKQGILGKGCVCGSTTLPLLTVPSATDPAQSCAYTSSPFTTDSNSVSILTST